MENLTKKPTAINAHKTPSQAVSFSFETSHSVTLTGLDDDTAYFFAVDVEDEAGNARSDDNGGACYSFTTEPVPDYFTEQFTAGLDLEGAMLTFTPNATVDFYDACAEELDGALPTDPTDLNHARENEGPNRTIAS